MAILVLVGAGVVVGAATTTPVVERITATFDADAPGGAGGRFDEWRVGTNVVRGHPLTGVGPEGYRVAFAEGVDLSYQQAHGRDPQPDRAHSAPLDVALVGGLPALGAWAIVTGSVVLAAWWALRRGPRWLAGVAAGVLAQQVASLLLFPTIELDPVAWLFGGVLLAWSVPRRGSRSQTIGGPAGRAVVVGPAILVAGLVLAGAAAGTTELVADRWARQATDALAAGAPGRAVEAVDRAIALRPDVVRYHLLAARARVAADRGTHTGLAALDEALAWSPDDPIALRARLELLVDRARATSVPAHAEAARIEADRLLARDPLDAGAWLQAGTAALLVGDEVAARGAWSRAEELAPTNPAATVNLALLDLEAGRLVEASAGAARARARAPDDPRVEALLAALAEADHHAGPARSGEDRASGP